MPSLIVGDYSAYVGEGVVGGEAILLIYGSYTFEASGIFELGGLAQKSIYKLFNSEGNLEFSGEAARARIKSYAASGNIVFEAAATSLRLTQGASIWDGRGDLAGGILIAGGSIWEGSTSPGGTVVSISNNIWRSV